MMDTSFQHAFKTTKLGKWWEEKKEEKKHFAEVNLKSEAPSIMDVLNRLKSAVTSVIPGNPLGRDFDIQVQVASTGPGLLWKVFSAVKRSTKEEAAVFLFEKKSVDKLAKRDREAVIESLRRGVQQLTKLRHPRILSVIHPLEETREALAFATEPVFASLANVLGSCDNLMNGSKALSEFQLFEVEIKHGLLQILEGLGFLHNDAKMMHRNICPSSIILAKFGTWKLAGCEFVQQATGDSHDQKVTFSCHDWRSDIPPEAQPHLDYLAPEYEIQHTCSPASDMFSFGILMYTLFNKGKPPYECHGEIRTFRENAEELCNLKNSLLSCVPSELTQHIKLLLNLEPTIRPDAAQMMKIPFFEDMACIALQYIDSLYQRENIEKSNFFKSLPKVIECLPKRVSQQRILPALFKEGVNANMVPFILPSIFLISEQSTTEEFKSLVLPDLIPFFKIREPIQVMLMFLQNMNLLLSKTPAQQIQTYVFPLIFAAIESESPQIQELCLSIIPTFADLIEYTTLKKSLIPRVKKLCLATSVLNVRVNCLLCIGKLLDQMDKWFVLDEILPFLREIPSREPAVLMTILGIHKVALSEPKLGITKDVMANKVLPFLIPLCIDSTLNLNQFNAYMGVVKEMLLKVETEHRTKLEQLDQIQQEHKTLEISKIIGDNGKPLEGKSTFMDKFWSGIGFGAADNTKSASDVSTNAQVTVSPKKTTLSLEEKQTLAKQKEQEKTLKSQMPLTPQSSSASKPNVSSTANKPNLPSGPKDLTSTLMESNMRNLSISSKPAAGSNIGPMAAGAVTNRQGLVESGTVNWSYMSTQPYKVGQSSPGQMSSMDKPSVNLLPLDSLMTPSSSAKKMPLNQLKQPLGAWPTVQPNIIPPGLNAPSHQGWGQPNSSFPSMQMSGFHQATSAGGTMNQGWSSGLMQPNIVSTGVPSKSLTSDDLKDLLG